MTSTGANTAAIAAALNGTGPPIPQVNRQSLTLKRGGSGHGFEATPGSVDVPEYKGSNINTGGRDDALIDDDELMQDDGSVIDDMPHGRADKGMNQDSSMPPDTAKTSESDHSSASPDISATSEHHDDYISSAETTPPPVNEPAYVQDSFSTAREKRHSGSSSAFSRSYQSAPSSSYLAGSVPSSSYGQQYPGQRRPSTSGVASASQLPVDEDEAGLAAAVQSLCSFGTPRTGPVHLPPGVPPVPPLPAQYMGQNANRLSANIMTPTLYDYGLPPTAAQRTSNERGSKNMESRTAYHNDEDDIDQFSVNQIRNDDDEEGVFGRMDE
ncbi:MAG: hypothetical protein Q9181_001313 [Wetmoreana brouardii]